MIFRVQLDSTSVPGTLYNYSFYKPYYLNSWKINSNSVSIGFVLRLGSFGNVSPDNFIKNPSGFLSDIMVFQVVNGLYENIQYKNPLHIDKISIAFFGNPFTSVQFLNCAFNLSENGNYTRGRRKG